MCRKLPVSVRLFDESHVGAFPALPSRAVNMSHVFLLFYVCKSLLALGISCQLRAEHLTNTTWLVKYGSRINSALTGVLTTSIRYSLYANRFASVLPCRPDLRANVFMSHGADFHLPRLKFEELPFLFFFSFLPFQAFCFIQIPLENQNASAAKLKIPPLTSPALVSVNRPPAGVVCTRHGPECFTSSFQMAVIPTVTSERGRPETECVLPHSGRGSEAG